MEQDRDPRRPPYPVLPRVCKRHSSPPKMEFYAFTLKLPVRPELLHTVQAPRESVYCAKPPLFVQKHRWAVLSLQSSTRMAGKMSSTNFIVRVTSLTARCSRDEGLFDDE